MARTYGRREDPEDPTRCIESVWPADDAWSGGRQCSRKRGHGPDGLYCKQHNPEVAKRRAEQQRAVWAAENREKERVATQRLAAPSFYRALKRIADGANDAREIARDAIAEYAEAFEPGETL